MTITNDQEVIDQVIDLTEKERSAEDITVLLFMTGVKSTKAECRALVTKTLKDANLTAVKKVPMSVQLKEWFIGLEDPINMTKEELVKKINDIGMNGGSVKWYTDMYMSAIELAIVITKKEEETK